MSTYIDVPVVTDPDTLAQDAYDFIQAQIPGWVPNAGNLDTWVIEAIARMAAETSTVASSVPASIFRYFGQLVGITPINATPASTTATFTTVDTAGYTIPAGTVVAIAGADGSSVPFVLTADLVIPNGQSTGIGSLVALNPGDSGSGLGGATVPATLITTIAAIASVTLNAATVGGLDAETDSAYLNRLVGELRLLTPRPILPNDFAVLARNVAGVGRALGIDGYQPTTNEVQQLAIVATGGTFTLTFGGHTTGTIAWNASAATVQTALAALSSIGAGNVSCSSGPLPGSPVLITFIGALGGADQAAITGSATGLTGTGKAVTITTLVTGGPASVDNERTISVALLDANGNTVSNTVKGEVQALLDGLREVNFVVNVIDPTFTQVDVSFTVSVLTGFDGPSTVAAVSAAITNFLTPANWGRSPNGDSTTWINNSSVRLLDLAAVIKSVPGVAFITELDLAIHGATLEPADVPLAGIAPVPSPGTISGSFVGAPSIVIPPPPPPPAVGPNLYQPWWENTSFWNTPIGSSPTIDPSNATWMATLLGTSIVIADGLVFNGGANVSGAGSTTVYHANSSTPTHSIALDFADVYGRNPVVIPLDPSWVCSDTTGDMHMSIICDEDITISGHTYVQGTVIEFQALNLSTHAAHAVAYENVLTDSGAAPSPDGISVLPIDGGLITEKDIASGVIAHAIRLGCPACSTAFRKPARHSDGATTNGPPSGALLQLKPSTSLAGLDLYQTMVCVALKTYGGYIGDESGAFNAYVESTRDGTVFPTDWSDAIPFSVINGNLQVIAASSVPGVTY